MSEAQQDYLLRSLPSHLIDSHQRQRYVQVLTTFEFLFAKLVKLGAQSLIDDYELASFLKGTTTEEAEVACQSVEVIREALLLSSHILSSYPTQLAAQLLGRLLQVNNHHVYRLLEGARHWKGADWLRPLTGSLVKHRDMLVRTLTLNTKSVRALAVTPDGTRVIMSPSDGTLKIWNLETGSMERTLSSHTHEVTVIVLTPDGRLMASASLNVITVRNLPKGDVLRKFTFDELTVDSLEFVNGGKSLLASVSPGGIKILELSTGEERGELVGHTHRVFDLAAIPNTERAISASGDGTLKIWDLKTGQEFRTLKGHSHIVSAVAVMPDGKQAVSASHDRTLKIWDLKEGKERLTLAGHKDWILSVALKGNGSQIVSGSFDGTMKLWDLKDGKELVTLSGHDYAVNDVAITPDGRRAVSASDDGTVKIWDIESPLSNGSKLTAGIRKHEGPVLDVKILQKGKLALSASGDTTLKVWDLSSGKVIHILRGHARPVNSVAVTTSGDKAVSGSIDGTIKVWDISRGSELYTFGGHTDSIEHITILRPTYRMLVKNLLRAVSRPGSTYPSLSAFNRLGATMSDMAVTTSRKTIKVWNVDTGEELHTFQVNNIRPPIAITRDRRHIISCTSNLRERQWLLRIWAITSGQELRTLTGLSDYVGAHVKNSIVVSGSSRHLVTASEDRTIKVWNLKKGEVAHDLGRQPARLTLLSVPLKGQLFASAGVDGGCRVWDLVSGGLIHQSRKHEKTITSAPVTRDGRYIVTTSIDGHLRLWNLYSGETIAQFTADNSILCCDIGDDASLIVAGDKAGSVHILRHEEYKHSLGRLGGASL